MAILPIVTYNDPILLQKAEPIEALTAEIESFIEDLFETMEGADGVGLAAPQVGRSVRIFVMNADLMYDEEDKEALLLGDQVFINPEIVEYSEEKVTFQEGCLSLPGLLDEVLRPEKIRIRFKDESFQDQELTLDGWNARVVQHELDHLDGILFIDHISAFKRAFHRSLLQKIDEGSAPASYPLVKK